MERILDNISWHINEDLDTVKYVEETEGQDFIFYDMTDEKWNEIAIPVQHPENEGPHYAHIIVNVGRFVFIKKVLRVSLPCTVSDVLKGISDIYQSPMTEAQVNEHEDDIHGIKADALHWMNVGEVVQTHEMNGDRHWFEGLRKLQGSRDTIFEICLGA